jgi:fructose-bisphosphate aldolase/2-amino-3,7-dideoxy-D-threo-hept-6-ulosonate synthase
MIAMAARIAAEHGADFVKTTYSGDVESFRRVVQAATVPLLVLGGERIDSDRATLELTYGAIAAGAAGVAIGRNIWNHSQPQEMTAAIAAIVHRNASVAEALDMLK